MSNDLTSFMVYVVVFLSIMIYEGGKRFKSFFSRGEITLSKSLILDRKRKTTAMDSSVRTESVEQNQVLCVSCGKEIENPNTGDFPVCLTCSSEKTSERVKEKKRVHVYYMKNKGKKGIVEVLSLLRIDNPETSSSLTLEDFRSNYTLVPLVLDVVDLDHLNRMLSITDNKNKSLETRKNLSIGDIVFVPVDEKLYIRHIMGWKQLAVSFTDELAFETVLTTNNKTGNEIKLILTGLLHDKEEVRLNSVRMVGSIAKKTGTNKLLSELKRNKDVVVILIETLGDQSKNVSLEAIETLGLLSVAGVDVLDPFITFIVISWESLNEEVLEKSLRLLIELAPSSDQITALENLLPEIMSKSSADTARVITELMTLMLDNVRIVNCQKCGTKCPEFIHDEQQLCFGCLKEIEEKKIKTVGSTETKRVHVYYQKSDGDPTQITQKLEENENNFYSHIFALDENTTTDTDISSEYFNQFYVKLPICLDVISLDQVFMIMNGLTKTPPPMISKKNIEWLKNNGVSHIHLQPGDIVFQVETAQCFMYSYGSWIDLSLVLLDELDGSTEVPSTEVPETSNGSEYQNEKKITGDLPANNLNRETSFEDIIEKIEEYSASDLAATDSDIDFEIELAKSKLKDSKKEVRLQALNDLGEINDLRITRLLFNSLDDVDHTVRETAARIFSKVTRPILNVVINGHYRSELKETAKHLLEKYEPFISDQPDDLEIDGEKLQVLTRKFKTGNSNTRLDVLSSVTEINSVEIYGLIFVALNDPSLPVVFRALRTLEYLNDKRPDDRTVIIEALLTFVTDKSSNMNDTVLAKLIELVTKIADSVEAQESIKAHPKLESLLDILNTLSKQSKADRIKTSARKLMLNLNAIKLKKLDVDKYYYSMNCPVCDKFLSFIIKKERVEQAKKEKRFIQQAVVHGDHLFVTLIDSQGKQRRENKDFDLIFIDPVIPEVAAEYGPAVKSTSIDQFRFNGKLPVKIAGSSMKEEDSGTSVKKEEAEKIREFYKERFNPGNLYKLIRKNDLFNREFGYTVFGKEPTRNLFFDTFKGLQTFASKIAPESLLIGAKYLSDPEDNFEKNTEKMTWQERELVFEFDISGIDAVRTCSCKGEQYCGDCLELVEVNALFIRDTVLKGAGFKKKDINIIFSGRQTLIAWITEKTSASSTKERRISLVTSVKDMVTGQKKPFREILLGRILAPHIKKKKSWVQSVTIRDLGTEFKQLQIKKKNNRTSDEENTLLRKLELQPPKLILDATSNTEYLTLIPGSYDARTGRTVEILEID